MAISTMAIQSLFPPVTGAIPKDGPFLSFRLLPRLALPRALASASTHLGPGMPGMLCKSRIAMDLRRSILVLALMVKGMGLGPFMRVILLMHLCAWIAKTLAIRTRTCCGFGGATGLPTTSRSNRWNLPLIFLLEPSVTGHRPVQLT